MITDDYSLSEVLEHLDCADCDYSEWVQVGMALKAEGHKLQEWEDWSKRDAARFKEGECANKWWGFHRDDIKAGTIIKLAMSKGWKPEQKHSADTGNYALDWDSEIGNDGDYITVPVQHRSLEKPGDNYSPGSDFIEFMRAVFEPGNMVNLVPSRFSQERDKWEPDQNNTWSDTRDNFIQRVEKAAGDMGHAFPGFQQDGGAWIIVNPTDGNGRKKENINKWECALVENDSQSLEEQWSLLHKLHIPIRSVVYSGGKSLHALVHIGAADESEYSKRVQKLYAYCKENGFELDKQNSNSNRLTRVPGFRRGDNWQYMVSGRFGPDSWNEWVKSLEEKPDEEGYPTVCFGEAMWNLPPRKPELIQGVLRETHKMMVSAPSKAGKSFLVIELAVCLAEGLPWLGHLCKQCTVLYTNLEGDSASFMNRVEATYAAKGLDKQHRPGALNLHMFNGRGMDLSDWAQKISEAAHRVGAKAVILDPIYKLGVGDENNAREVAVFCRELDRIAAAGISVIYVHHFSKGSQGAKSSMDRASGSGVFARDADAIVSLIQLRVPEEEVVQFHSEYGENAALFRVEYDLREFPPHIDDYTVFTAPLHPIIQEDWVKSAKLEETVRAKEAKMNGKTSGEPEPDKTEELLELMRNDLKTEGKLRKNEVYAVVLGVATRTITRYRKDIIAKYGNLPGQPGYNGPAEQLSMEEDGQADMDTKAV